MVSGMDDGKFLTDSVAPFTVRFTRTVTYEITVDVDLGDPDFDAAEAALAEYGDEHEVEVETVIESVEIA